MRWFKLTFLSLTVLLVVCAPALAQSSPSSAQYDPVPFRGCPPDSERCISQSLGDGADDFADNAEQGTEAVNGAMDNAVEAPATDVPAPNAPTPNASASAEAIPSAETGASPASATSPDSGGEEGGAQGGAPADGAEGPVSITELPETGGVSLTTLVSGLLLVTLGLIVRRTVGR